MIFPICLQIKSAVCRFERKLRVNNNNFKKKNDIDCKAHFIVSKLTLMHRNKAYEFHQVSYSF